MRNASTIAKRWDLWTVIGAAALLSSPLILVHPWTPFGEGTSFFAYPYTVVKHLITVCHVWPVWDPYSGSGDPLLHNPLAGQWYPPAWLAFMTPTVFWGLRCVVYLHVVAAAAGGYTLARWIGCRPLAALLVPIGFLWNPYIVMLQVNGLPGPLYALTWFSWGMAFIWRGATRNDPRWLVGAGACLAAQILGGTTYEMHFTALAYGLSLAYIACTTSGSWVTRGHQLLTQAAIVYGVTLGLGAAKLLPVLEYGPLSTRTTFSLRELEQLGQNPSASDLVREFFQFFGNPGTPESRWINGLYAGLALPLLWPLQRTSPLRRPALLFSGLLLIMLWIALGPQAPLDLFAWMYRLVPGFRYSPYTGRILSICRLAIPVLAAVGATALLDYTATRSPWLATLAHRTLVIGLVMSVGWICIPYARYIAQYPYGILQPTHVGRLAALARTPQVILTTSPMAYEGTVSLKNIGDETWPAGTPIDWMMDNAITDTTRITTLIRPGQTVSLQSHGPVATSAAPEPHHLSLRWGGAPAAPQLIVATMTARSSGHLAAVPAAVGTDESIAAGHNLLGQGPKKWNALLGTLARWHAEEPFRVFSGTVGSVFPLTAFLHGFEMISFSNHGMMPKYHLFVRYKDPHDPGELGRVYKMFRILNTRYVIMAHDYLAVDPTRTRPIVVRPDAGIYELTAPLPRVWIPQAVALIVGEDRDHDFQSLEAKLAVYHSAFDPAVWAVFTPATPRTPVTVAEARSFDAVLVTHPTHQQSFAAEATLADAHHIPSRLLDLPYTEIPYTDPHKASNSMLSDEAPAKALSPQTAQALEALLRAGPVVPPGSATAILEFQRPTAWRIRVQTTRSITPVVISETFFPGWRATIDGQPSPVYMADGIVRGLLVRGPGDHVVELQYHPWTAWAGAMITLGSLIAVLLWYGRGARRG